MPMSSRRARLPTSLSGPLRLPRRAYQASAHAVAGSVTYQATSTERLQIWPRYLGPSWLPHHGSARYVWVRVSSDSHVPGSAMWLSPPVTMKQMTSAQ